MQKALIALLILTIISCSTDKKQPENNGTTESEQPTQNIDSKLDVKDSTLMESIDSVNNTAEKINEEVILEEAEKVVEAPKPKPKPIPKKLSKIHVEYPVHEFGRVTETDIVEHTFQFINAGEGDLTIKDVLVDCGCTVPEYPKKPIKPGQSGSIAIKFDTKGKIGMQERIITILTNGQPKSKIVRLKGIVGTETKTETETETETE